MKNTYANSLHTIFLGASVACFLIGFSDLLGPILSGLGRAMGGIFFILFFICRLLKDEHTDEELAHSAKVVHERAEAEPRHRREAGKMRHARA
jgi:hypothetical protein